MARNGAGKTLWHPVMQSGMAYLRGNLPDAQPTPITGDARLSFASAFGVPIARQIAMERYYDTCDLKWDGVTSIGVPPPAHLF